MTLVLIGSAIASFLIVTGAAISLGRRVLAFSRTADRLRRLVEPYVQRITHMVEVIQNRILRINDRTALLQQRLLILNSSMRMLKILVDAWQKAIEPLNRARSYVGL